MVGKAGFEEAMQGSGNFDVLNSTMTLAKNEKCVRVRSWLACRVVTLWCFFDRKTEMHSKVPGLATLRFWTEFLRKNAKSKVSFLKVCTILLLPWLSKRVCVAAIESSKGQKHGAPRNCYVIFDAIVFLDREKQMPNSKVCICIKATSRILTGTKVYTEAHKIVETALGLLEIEAGPLDHVYARMMHRIVSRLSCGVEVHKLCSTAVECFDLKLSELFSSCEEKKEAPTCSLHFEECLPTSVVIVLEYKDKLLKNFLGCRLWHGISSTDYLEQPTFICFEA
ncbi:hypothetical protein KIW84_045800 [Lathyrus oleraceus]|uniref:Uncharacterized protein n=1 Tax=Pisum sativum TaxID=3888 RepID=A0A9D5AS99_PEA|nr:hypothetical protein KIW84_045800 [Pisum sativum]